MTPLTERQDQILQIIRNSLRERGIPPTRREISAASGISSLNGVAEHLRTLERKGWIRLATGSRGIRLTDEVSIDICDLSIDERAQVVELLQRIRSARAA